MAPQESQQLKVARIGLGGGFVEFIRVHELHKLNRCTGKYSYGNYKLICLLGLHRTHTFDYTRRGLAA
jgi:hypothetical protein